MDRDEDRTSGRGHWWRAGASKSRLLATVVVAVTFFAAGCGAASTTPARHSPKSQKPNLLQAIKSSGKLSVGVISDPPHEYQNPKTGQWEGMYVDLMKDWAKRLHVKLVYVTTSFETIVAGLQAHKFEFGLALDNTPERAQAVDFSIGVTTDLMSVAVVPGTSHVTNWSELTATGHTLGLILGTEYQPVLAADHLGASIVTYPTASADQLALLAGRETGYADGWAALAEFAQANPGVKIIFPPKEIGEEAANIAVDKGYGPQALKALNAEIRRYIKSGGLHKAALASDSVNPMDYAIGSVPTYIKKLAPANFGN